MNKLVTLLLTALLAVGMTACDNKSKEKVVNGVVLTDAGGGNGGGAMPADYPPEMTATSAVMITHSGAGLSYALGAPIRRVMNRFTPVLPTGPDAEGYYTMIVSGISMRLLFMNASDAVLTLAGLGGLSKVRARFGYTYVAGAIFDCDFTVTLLTNAITGSVTSADPYLGTFTATLAGVTYDEDSDENFCLPKSGTMTLASSTGYTGACTFSKPGSDYLCVGSLTTPDGQTISVNLTYNDAADAYTGTWTNTTTGESGTI